MSRTRVISRLGDRIAIHSIQLHSSSPYCPSLVPKISVRSDMDDVNPTHAVGLHDCDPCLHPSTTIGYLIGFVSRDMVAL